MNPFITIISPKDSYFVTFISIIISQKRKIVNILHTRVWLSLISLNKKTASITSQSNSLKFGPHPLKPFYLSFFLYSFGKSGTGSKIGSQLLKDSILPSLLFLLSLTYQFQWWYAILPYSKFRFLVFSLLCLFPLLHHSNQYWPTYIWYYLNLL